MTGCWCAHAPAQVCPPSNPNSGFPGACLQGPPCPVQEVLLGVLIVDWQEGAQRRHAPTGPVLLLPRPTETQVDSHPGPAAWDYSPNHQGKLLVLLATQPCSAPKNSIGHKHRLNPPLPPMGLPPTQRVLEFMLMSHRLNPGLYHAGRSLPRCPCLAVTGSMGHWHKAAARAAGSRRPLPWQGTCAWAEVCHWLAWKWA